MSLFLLTLDTIDIQHLLVQISARMKYPIDIIQSVKASINYYLFSCNKFRYV